MSAIVEATQFVDTLFDLKFGRTRRKRFDAFDCNVSTFPNAMEYGSETAGAKNTSLTPIVRGYSQFIVADFRYFVIVFDLSECAIIKLII